MSIKQSAPARQHVECWRAFPYGGVTKIRKEYDLYDLIRKDQKRREARKAESRFNAVGLKQFRTTESQGTRSIKSDPTAAQAIKNAGRKK